MNGKFPAEPTRVSFDLEFVAWCGDRKLIRIHVKVGDGPRSPRISPPSSKGKTAS